MNTNTTPEFKALSPFEKTVLLQLVKLQSFSSASCQISSSSPGEQIPPLRDILQKAQMEGVQGMLETLKNNS